MSPDPLAPLDGLPGIAEAVAGVRTALDGVYRHPANRRGWPATAAAARLRAARASAALDGAPIERGDTARSPVLAGAVRAAEESGRLLATWRVAPLQALARLHVLAAADLVPADRRTTELGCPRSDPHVSRRLAGVAQLLTGGTSVAAPVLVAVVHGELLTLDPFRSATGVVARAAAHLTAVTTGLDPKGLAVPEVGHLRHAAEYRRAAVGYASGDVDGLAGWLRHCCAQWEAGAREARSIADAHG
jgi:hypothetical protein